MAVETVTLMFTDLVGSTELLSRLGEEDAELLRRDHFGLLRDALVAHAGREVKNVGDGLMIAFESVSGALACAVAMQQSIERRNRAAVVPLAVRIGISHGDCDVEDGDYFGVPVVEAARLCARAGGDEILITDVVRWVAGSRGRFAFEPMGALELKGLDGAVVVHKVAWEPLPAGAGSLDVPLPGAIAARANTVFVGRVSERAVLADALKAAAAARRRRIVLLEGEAGIGKTTLVSSFARDAHTDGAIVLYGRCDEDLSVPYQPWAEALDHLARHLPESIVRAHVDERGADLSALVPALAARRDLPPRRSTDPETERHLLFGAVVDLLERATAEQSLVLVLDDLHWVDRPSLQLFRHVIAAPSEMQLLVLATFRGTDVGAGHPLADARAALYREEGVERVALRGLDDLELLALMEASAGHPMDASEMALRDELLAETDGNPFFAIEILRHLVETGAITESGGHWVAEVDPRTHGLPVSVREVIGRRVERLGVNATPALAAAAVVGREFELALVAAASELAEAALLDVIDAAVAAHVIAEVPGAPDRFVFVHALIQHTLYDDLSAARRRRLHRRVAEALEAMPGDPDDCAADLARHWYASLPDGVDKAYEYSVAAGECAQRCLGPAEAVRWFSQALELVDRLESNSERSRCDVLVRLGTAQRLAGDATFRETLLDAGRQARALGDVDRLAAAALANTRGFPSTIGQVDRDRIELLRDVIDAVGASSPEIRTRLLSLLALESHYASDIDTAALIDEALTLARTLDDDDAKWAALNAQHNFFTPQNLPERLATLDEIVAVGSRGDAARRCWTAATQAVIALESGDVSAWRQHARSVVEFADEVGDPALRWMASWHRHGGILMAGDVEGAERLADASFAVATAAGQPDALTVYGAQILNTREVQGRTDEVLDLLIDAAASNPAIPGFRAALARTYANAGRREDARAALDDFCAQGIVNIPVDPVWASCIVELAHAIGLVEHVTAAEQLLPLVEPFRDRLVWSGATFHGPIVLAVGIVERVTGRHDDADRDLADAVAVSEAMDAPYWLALSRLELAIARRARNSPGDDAVARELAGAAAGSALRNGFGAITRRAAALL
jgi:class 3 adenylate cyclase